MIASSCDKLSASIHDIVIDDKMPFVFHSMRPDHVYYTTEKGPSSVKIMEGIE